MATTTVSSIPFRFPDGVPASLNAESAIYDPIKQVFTLKNVKITFLPSERPHEVLLKRTEDSDSDVEEKKRSQETDEETDEEPLAKKVSMIEDRKDKEKDRDDEEEKEEDKEEGESDDPMVLD